MSRQNCWEYKKCGREPGGAREHERGLCPAALETRTDGINGGKNGGRVCWAVAGTLCGGEVQGSFCQKLGNCMRCDFFDKVLFEEGGNYAHSKDILKKLARLPA